MLIETITDNKTNTWRNTPNVNRSANFCLLNNTKMITFFSFIILMLLPPVQHIFF